MPRRSRPASRGKSGEEKSEANVTSSSKVQLPLPKTTSKRKLKAVDPEPGSDGEEWDDEEPSSDSDEDEGDDDDVSLGETSEESDVDVDAPRVAQWVDEDDVDQPEIASGDASHGKAVVAEDIDIVQDNLASLPLGALRRAQRALARAQAEENPSESEDEGSGSGSEPEEVSAMGKESKPDAHKPEWSNKPRTDIAKRANKNAPLETTSKKPVTRRRQIVEIPKMEVRDPRFLPFTGKLQPQLYRQSYGFLADMHKTEFSTLKENLKRAKKMLASSPRDQREEREQEVAKLEQAVKRAESNMNRDKREQIEQDALRKTKQEEKEKRKAGKGAWHMKDSEKRKLLIKARYDALAAEGGKRAVRKAVEKKQKKIGQKEKKSRPFDSKPPPSRKRSFEGGRDGEGGRKRIRTQ